MGLKTKINRLLCIPCNMLLRVYQKMKKYATDKHGSPARTIYFVAVASMFIVMFWCLSYVFSLWIYAPLARHFERSLVGRHSVEDSFLQLYKNGITRINTRSGKDTLGAAGDEFSKPNFLHVKLQQLVALTYLSSPFNALIHKDEKFQRQLLSVGIEKGSIRKTNFTFLLNELNIAIKVQNFYSRQWGCPQLASLRFPNQITRTPHTTTGTVVHNGKNIALQTTMPNMDELMSGRCGSADSDKSHDNQNRCFLLKNRGMLQQYLFLQELSHPNVAKLYGVCVSIDQTHSPNSFIIAKETGLTVDIEQLKTQSWNLRLQVTHDLVHLATYLATSPMGSILLENWNPEHFIITQDSSSALLVKLTDFDQKIILTEKTCTYSRDCSIGKVSSATKCRHGICEGYNDKYNLYNMYKSFLSPLLEKDIPSNVEDDSKKMLNAVRNLHCNSTVLMQLIKFLQTSSESVFPGALPGGDGNNIREAFNHHRDASQLEDSWEKRESNVEINDVRFDIQLPNQHNFNPPPEINNAGDAEDDEDLYKDTFGYKKIDNADYPGRYDYYCAHSKAEWGCVMSLRKLEEAARKCDDDLKCKAFVTMPHLRKEGWIIVILKSDNTRAVDHAGTTVYIKASGEAKSKKDKVKADASVDSGVVKLCLQDLLQTQESVREKREQQMMKACHWGGLSDSKWQSVILDATISDATKFKPSRGKMAVGGQMDVVLDSASKPSPALFLAKKGPEEFHLAQLATYHLDRMLGLFKILPAFLRTLTEQEMSDAGFPVDIGGNQFDVFRQLKNTDKSLAGTIVPMVSGRIGVKHYISVPKLAQITNAVTPFSKRQWDDLEYLLLMWLASLPMPAKGHPSLQGHLIHIKADEAFKSEPPPEVLSYFNNCQFPRIAIDVLRNLRSAHCNFGDQLIARIRTTYPDLPVSAFSFRDPAADIATRNANRLLEVVDLCVRKFGDSTVLYDS